MFHFQKKKKQFLFDYWVRIHGALIAKRKPVVGSSGAHNHSAAASRMRAATRLNGKTAASVPHTMPQTPPQPQSQATDKVDTAAASGEEMEQVGAIPKAEFRLPAEI